jgi:hypothetical protein
MLGDGVFADDQSENEDEPETSFDYDVGERNIKDTLDPTELKSKMKE